MQGCDFFHMDLANPQRVYVFLVMDVRDRMVRPLGVTPQRTRQWTFFGSAAVFVGGVCGPCRVRLVVGPAYVASLLVRATLRWLLARPPTPFNPRPTSLRSSGESRPPSGRPPRTLWSLSDVVSAPDVCLNGG